ncbi:RNA polymerase-associated protein leo1 [Anaeramoeba ignava]|uniref:RNA polymerase-associated protein leo1 n=1 Tax=Anaeramoeba ignava TaxID=1746090 RepID=A0A9Q0LJM2_ANAIG|nr:RNA polymerase-associated protein leo1 [Anaeramoeba ignava]
MQNDNENDNEIEIEIENDSQGFSNESFINSDSEISSIELDVTNIPDENMKEKQNEEEKYLEEKIELNQEGYEIKEYEEIPEENKIYVGKKTRFIQFEEDEFKEKKIIKENIENLTKSGYVVRWRYNDKTKQKESNSRIVKWSDGSVHLVIGSEYVNIEKLKHDNSHLFCLSKENNLLLFERTLLEKFSYKPVSLNTKIHHAFSRDIKERHKEKPKSRMLVPIQVENRQVTKKSKTNKHSKKK